ncbi:MAG: tRNA threonylcarbamoyladenosine dehydratase [Paludibacteraceae bacterium]|nr:tRNA threonylcarbamoyladenosine dehydratase [Paludibacteraceae bacterium]
MDDFFSRSEALLGAEAMEALREKRVIIFGVGGVGSWCAEALVRTGLTHLTIVDDDLVQASNINRQLPAIRKTIGRAKVEVLRERLLTINPDAEIIALQRRYEAQMENGKWKMENEDFPLEGYDYIIDAIDSVADKTDLILRASRVRGCKVFSSMGAALRFDPTQVRTAELFDVKGDALAKAVRARMKKLDLHPYKKIRCVYSLEQAQRCDTRGSLMQVTAVFGCTLASLIIRDLL